MGWQEKQIIANFGNPSEVAVKILSEYTENNSETTLTLPPSYHNAIKTQTDAAPPPAKIAAADSGKAALPPHRKSVIRKVLAVLGGIIGVILSIVFWTISIALIISGWVMLIGGLGTAILSLFYLGGNTAGAVANLGIALVAAAIGLFLAGLTKRLIKLCARSCRLVLKTTKRRA